MRARSDKTAGEPCGAHLPIIPQQVACRVAAGMTATGYGRAGATVRYADAAECRVRLMLVLVTIRCICSGIRVDRPDAVDLAGTVGQAELGGQRDGQVDSPGEPGRHRAGAGSGRGGPGRAV